MLTLSELQAIMPAAGSRAPTFLEPLNVTFDEFSIDTPDRQAPFLAQCAHESAQLSRLVENMNYGPERLTQVWSTRFPNVAVALPYAHHPEKLANHVYANRGGNGDEKSGDGWRHRGAGLIQLTFKDSQLACARYFGIDGAAICEWLQTPEGASRSAGWFWLTRGLNPLADQGQFKAITRRINPGLVGLDDRIKHLERAVAVLA